MENQIKADFYKVWKALRQDANYVTRPYKTIGGMWTVDTWKMGEITAQLQDEGWTQRIFTDLNVLDVYLDGSGNVRFSKGTAVELADLAEQIPG